MKFVLFNQIALMIVWTVWKLKTLTWLLAILIYGGHCKCGCILNTGCTYWVLLLNKIGKLRMIKFAKTKFAELSPDVKKPFG